jgi:AcrR family transcriptional regulator
VSAATNRRPGPRPKFAPEELRARVLTGARQVFAAKGLAAATIGEIARAAGVSRQAVYEQFRDKDEIFQRVLDELLARRIEGAQRSAATVAPLEMQDSMRDGYSTTFTFNREHPDAEAIFAEATRTGNPAMKAHRRQIFRIVIDADVQGWAKRGIDVGRAVYPLVTMFAAMSEALTGMNRPDGQPDDDVLIDLLTEFTIGGLTRLVREAPEVLDKLR